MDSPPGACPCTHGSPCHERCSCVMTFSSSGCRRCCSYGSIEQRQAKAKRLIDAIDSAHAFESMEAVEEKAKKQLEASIEEERKAHRYVRD